MADNGTAPEAKLKLKIGSLTLSVEGSEDFVGKTRDRVLPANFDPSQLISAKEVDSVGDVSDVSDAIEAIDAPDRLGFGMETYASKFGVSDKSRANVLLVAAACYLKIEKGKDTFTTVDLREAIKEAGSYYDESKHGRNFNATFKRLVGNKRFIHKGGANYAASAGEIEKARQVLATD